MTTGSTRRRWAGAGLAAAAAIVAALWVAVCAAAPEFVWQGLRIAQGHLNSTDLAAALLLGAVLAFFVEPAMRRLHDLVTRERHREPGERGNPLFAAGLGLAFALVSVAVHDALAAFISARGAGHAGPGSGLEAALLLAAAWAVVPAAVGLAWLAAGCRWLKLPLGLLAAGSAGIAGWLFSWSRQEVITTAIPCLVILGLGYRRVASGPRRGAFARCAPVVAGVAAVWLSAAVLLDIVLGSAGFAGPRLYPAADFWIDVRFYLGWTLGLLLAPSPDSRATEP
jgi:hypothetical protein